MVKHLKSCEKEFKGNVGWLFTDAADKLYACAKERVLGSIQQQSKMANSSVENRAALCEENPKWRALTDIIAEIEEANKVDSTVGKVLIAVNSTHTCNQLKDYLIKGSHSILIQLLRKLEQPKEQKPSSDNPVDQNVSRKSNKKEKQRASSAAAPDQATLTQLARGEKPSSSSASKSTDITDMIEDEADDEADGSICVVDDDRRNQPFSPHQTTVLLSLHGSGDPYCLIRALESLRPRYIILYDVEVSFIRQIEVYKACRPGEPLRVYFLMFSGSSEEQHFLTSIRKEKESFEQLIRTKATMVIPENRDGKYLDNVERGSKAANQTVSSRKGGIQAPSLQHKQVIVDMREFRSDLPFLVHKLSIDLVPATLEVGDYILTPDICVERKSISDLIGSLNNGRLYNQCVAMSRYYKRPVLLIEFDPKKPFSLQKNFSLQQEISINDIQSRLSLLTLHFPTLRILWCQSAHATADLFKELKQDCDEPDVSKALTVTTEDNSGRDSRYNVTPYDLLLKIPDITLKNVRLILDKVKSMKEFSNLTVEKLSEIIDNRAFAENIIKFINKEYVPEVSDKKSEAPSNKRLKSSLKRSSVKT